MSRPNKIRSKYFHDNDDSKKLSSENEEKTKLTRKRKLLKNNRIDSQGQTKNQSKKPRNIIKKSNTGVNNKKIPTHTMNRRETSKSLTDTYDSDDDENDDDWEEVEDSEVFDLDDYKPDIPDNIQISLNDSQVQKPKKKSKDPIEAAIRSRINRYRKELQMYMHQCSLLFSIYRLQYLNSIIQKPLIQSLTLSISDLIPQFRIHLGESLTGYLKKFSEWFRKYFKIRFIDDDHYNVIPNFEIELIYSFEKLEIHDYLIVHLIIVLLLRYSNLMVRLCYLLDPIPTKPPNLLGIGKNSSLSVESNNESKLSKPKNSRKFSQDRFWVEVFDDGYNKWIYYDLFSGPVHFPQKLFKNNTQIAYVLGIDNDDYITEVTARYATDWISFNMEKRRVNDKEWWQRVLDRFKRRQYSRFDDADKVEFEKLVSDSKIPTKLGHYKNHPLYVLQKDLLKFQAIYPPDAPTLGFCNSHPVYSRSCVHTLKSRETWLRVARTVRLDERPYKIVQSRFKWKKTTNPGTAPEKETLELFGEWQTEEYKPPVAKDGIVPRNAYGNVDLFQSSMLPIGTVHLKLPGLLRIANKLKIDCAPAIVGFEANAGGSHPVMDGFVVCQEHREILIDAWNEEELIKQKRDEEKRSKRVLDNWKRLLRGLILKRNLKVKYG